MKKLSKLLAILTLFALGTIVINTKTAKAATTFNITPTSDCTLADAISAADYDTPSGSCDAGSGTDTINMGAGTYTLTDDLPGISQDININGSGTSTTLIDGQNLYTIFGTGPGGASLNVSNVTIMGANRGSGAPAAISMNTLAGQMSSVENVIVRDSSQAFGVAAIVSGGGDVSINNLASYNNSYAGLYAVASDGTININNTTVSNNWMGLYVVKFGGGEVHVSNTTIANNSTTDYSPSLGGGLLVSDYSGGTTVDIKNTLLANNTSDGNPSNCGSGTVDGFGLTIVTPTSLGHNLSSDETCTTVFNQDGDQNNVDPLISTLADNGGDTFTNALAVNSPAIDAGDNSGAPNTDQRGISRPQCSGIDIGAYEYNGTCPETAPSELADISLTGSRVTSAPILSGMNLTYDLTIKNLGPGISNMENGIYASMIIPANSTYINATTDNADDFVECYEGGPAASEGSEYSQYAGNFVYCYIEPIDTQFQPNDSLTLSLQLTATHDFVVGEDTLHAFASDDNTTDPDFQTMVDIFHNGDDIFSSHVNNIINLVYGVNDTPSTSSDSDPIPDSVEDAAPGNGDGNNDGTPDSEQSNVTSLPNASGDYITLAVPEGVVIDTTTIAQASTLSTKDIAYTYPLGLVSFTATTDIGATIPIELYFYTTEKASTFTPRKYNATTNTYTTLSSLTQTSLTQTTINNQPVLKLSYQLQDGGPLDQDGVANGTIIDPVGLAQASVGVPNTGL